MTTMENHHHHYLVEDDEFADHGHEEDAFSLDRFLEDSEESATEYKDGAILRNTFMVYGSALLVLLVLFCWVRLKFPKVYNLRNWVPKIKTPLADDQFGFLSWMWRVYMVTEDEMLGECGLDALCLVRISQMGYKLCRAGILNAIWLLPLYATAQDSEETSSITDRIVQVTIAHVPSGSVRLIGTVLASYVVFGYAMYLIVDEFKWFLEMRHKYLRQAQPRNYSVLVRNIPTDSDGSRNSNATVMEFFRNCFPKEDVLEANVHLQAGNLAKIQAQRDAVVTKLERALELHKMTGERPTHKDSILPGVVGGGQHVDSIEAYQEELKQLDQDVSQRMTVLEQIAATGRTTITRSNRALLADSTPPPTQNVDIEAGSLTMESEITEDVESLVGGTAAGPSARTITKDETNEQGKSGAAGRGLLNSVQNVTSSAAAFVSGGEDGQSQPTAGFVTFTKLSTTQAARQMIHHPTPYAMQVMEAPDPDDVMWFNVNRTNKDLQLGKLASFGMTAMLCLLWTIPMSFVASLSTLSALRAEVGFIDDLLNAAPFLAPVFELLAPLLVVILQSILPVFLEFITLFEGPISSAMVEASMFVKLAAFMIIQTFFVSAISGGLLQELSNIANNPSSIVSLLANSLPAQSTYFIQIIFVTTVMFGGTELLRVVPVVMAMLRSCIGPRATEKERQTTFMGLRPLCDPTEFQHADVASQTVLYFMVFLVYAVISPITSFVIAFCFAYMGAIFRHQFIFIYPTQPDSGGKIWMGFIRILLVCLLIAEVTIVGLLALKEATIAIPLFIPLLIGTVLFSVYIRQVHFQVAEFLPTYECLKEDSKRRLDGIGTGNEGPEGLDFLRGAYKQPELAAEKQALVEGMDRGMTNTMTMATSMESPNHAATTGLPAKHVDSATALEEAALAVDEMQNMRQGHAVLSSVPSATARDNKVDNDDNRSETQSVVSSFLNSFFNNNGSNKNMTTKPTDEIELKSNNQ